MLQRHTGFAINNLEEQVAYYSHRGKTIEIPLLDYLRRSDLMSPKELLYIDDALGHEQHLKTKCEDFSGRVQDPELKTLIESLTKKHQEIFGKFYNLL